jgi:hypothetical protein
MEMKLLSFAFIESNTQASSPAVYSTTSLFLRQQDFPETIFL